MKKNNTNNSEYLKSIASWLCSIINWAELERRLNLFNSNEESNINYLPQWLSTEIILSLKEIMRVIKARYALRYRLH